MRESTGNALLMTLMTSVVAIVLSFLVGSISYSKSYRIKNHIIDEIEECQTFANCQDPKFSEWATYDSDLKNAEQNKDRNLSGTIGKYLKDVGYKYSNKETCPAPSDIYNGSTSKTRRCDARLHGSKEDYNYCVYRCYENDTNKFYHVITYMQMDFPLVNKVVNFKITGDTKSFY